MMSISIERIPPLRLPPDRVVASEIIRKYAVWHLPVIGDDFTMFGLLPAHVLIAGSERQVDDYKQDLIKVPILLPSTPIEELARIMINMKVSLIPVNDVKRKGYSGAVTIWQVIKWLQCELGTEEAGTLLWLEADTRKYSLSYIVRLIESEHGEIRMLRVMPQGNHVRLMIQFSGPPAARIIGALEHVGIKILEHSSLGEIERIYRERYEALMRYLDV